ncbi:MAG: universal stress protein [Armatimonadetes bacterium]|nr:universal stress protein [Akkermansiaceae bacterium]
MKKILAAIDFSNATSGVLKMAGEMAKAFGAELHLLHVIEPEPTYTAYGFTPEEFPAIQTFHGETRVRAQKTLDDAIKLVSGPGLKPIGHLGDGGALHVLSDKAEELKADLVVLGSHGHGIVAALLLGSVAEGMVRKSKVPTLVVPAGDPKQG